MEPGSGTSFIDREILAQNHVNNMILKDCFTNKIVSYLCLNRKHAKMKTSLSLLILFFISVNLLEAQQKDSSAYIYLKTGEYVFGDSIKIEYDRRAFLFFTSGTNYIYIDEKKYDVNDVRYVNDSNFLFAVVQHMASPDEPILAKRIEKGNINIYASSVFEYETVDTLRYDPDHIYYYSVGKDEVNELRFKNLKYVMVDDPEAMSALKKHRNMLVLERSLQAAAIAYFVADFIYFLDTTRDLNKESSHFVNVTDSKLGGILINMTIPVGLYLLGKIPHKKKKENIFEAVRLYNN